MGLLIHYKPLLDDSKSPSSSANWFWRIWNPTLTKKQKITEEVNIVLNQHNQREIKQHDVYNSICGTELKEENKKINAASNYYNQDDIWISALVFFSSLNDTFFFCLREQIVSVWVWFMQRARGCSVAQWQAEIYANSAQPGDTCRRPRRVITTRATMWKWADTCGTDISSRTCISANDHIQDANSSAQRNPRSCVSLISRRSSSVLSSIPTFSLHLSMTVYVQKPEGILLLTKKEGGCWQVLAFLYTFHLITLLVQHALQVQNPYLIGWHFRKKCSFYAYCGYWAWTRIRK